MIHQESHYNFVKCTVRIANSFIRIGTFGIFVKMILSVVILHMLILSTVGINAANPVIITNSGLVEGTRIASHEGRPVISFEGIPYAKPPVGDLRFKAPEPVEPWTTTLMANTTYTCIQAFPLYVTLTVVGTEDCLYLYIYVPRENITGTENFDVVVGIHGGAFMLGDPHMLCGPEYLMDRDVIYVSMNYRLGILGFLSTEDELVPGNNGLKDQVLALKWIKENIKYFGGNPSSVTLIGLSAGGASVHYHSLSPMSKGLFTRGFSQSGTALNPWALTKKPAEKARKLGVILNCTQALTSDMIGCLRQVDAATLISATDRFYVMLECIPYTPFGPVIEKGERSFLPDHPYKLLLDGKVNEVPWITSSTVNEGIYPVGFMVMYKQLELLDKNWKNIIASAMDYNDTVGESDKQFVSEKLRDFYLKNETLTMDNINQLINLFTDRVFLSGAEESLRLHARSSKSPVYYYLFDYKLEMSGVFPKTISGVAHSDDGRLLYPIIGNPSKLSSNDEKMKNMFVDFVRDFAAGREVTFGGVQWTPVESMSEDINHLHVSGPGAIQMKSVKELTPKEFWKGLPIIENEKLYKE